MVLEKGVTVGFEAALTAGGTGASFRATGLLFKSPAKGQDFELKVREQGGRRVRRGVDTLLSDHAACHPYVPSLVCVFSPTFFRE